jgi:hypothetical protein
LDAYLDIATLVLRAERRPLSARAILGAAYRAGLVPKHLHGRTQHKTLQARISEDIVLRRDLSTFFRTAPGRFFLREFLADTAIPERFRHPVPTRRRFRESVRAPVLAVDREALESIVERNTKIRSERILNLLKSDFCRYEDPRVQNRRTIFVRSFVCVSRGTKILTYRAGHYREDRNAFVNRRSIGFSTLVDLEAHTLFNFGTYGIIDSGISATRIDLDIPQVLKKEADERGGASLSYFLWVSDGSTATTDLLAVISFQCPDWFEPVKRRLAINDLTWLDLTKGITNIDDFDPWSKVILLTSYFNQAMAGTKNDHSSPVR